MNFSDLHLGLTAAEREAAREPDLLLGGYFDPHNIPSKILSGDVFLVLGPKGSGKSAVTEHLRLQSKENPHLFCERVELKDFPFRDFVNMRMGGQTHEARYPGGWAWLLLLALFSSFERDEGSSSRYDTDFLNSLYALRNNGFLPTPALREVILRSSQTTVKLDIPPLGGEIQSKRQKAGLHLYAAVETLRSIILRVRSSSVHIIAIDGLDQIFIHDSVQWQVIASLIQESDRLNSLFLEYGVPARIVILCRSDIYERLPLADANKIRLDSGIVLNWYPNRPHPEDSFLFDLADRKAGVAHPTVGSILDRFLPKTITVSPQGLTRVSIHEFLLRRTRHTPRDYLMLLKCIQEANRQSNGGYVAVSPQDVHEGTRQYCNNYFLQEIRNELVGMTGEDEARSAIDLLSTMESHVFSLSQLQKKALGDARFRNFDVTTIAQRLFDSGLVGNVTPAGNEKVYLTFRYRSPGVVFDPTQRLVLHEAAMTALNVPRRTAVSRKIVEGL